MSKEPIQLLSEEGRSQLLQDVFPGECVIIGPKNLRKISQGNGVTLVAAQQGSNTMFADLIILFVQAVEFADNFLSVYAHLKKEEPKPVVQNIINITINNNQVDVSKLDEKKIMDIAAYCMKLLESNEQ